MNEEQQSLAQTQEATNKCLAELAKAMTQQKDRASPNGSFVDVAMKIGIALCVAGILYVASTLQSVQMQASNTTIVLGTVKETVDELKSKYETADNKCKDVFDTEVQPYALRIHAAELATQENKQAVLDIKEAVSDIRYSVGRLIGDKER